MSVETVNGFVLLPHAPDWNVKPQFRREWRSTITDAVTGNEDRLSCRPLPLRGVEFQVTPYSFEEYRRLLARVLAARKSGWAAIPLWGRGCALASPASGDTVQLVSEDAWAWRVDDFVFFTQLDPDEPEAFETRQVKRAEGATLTLDQALSRTYRRFCWPLILGRFNANDISTLTSRHGSIRIGVLERDTRTVFDVSACLIPEIVNGGGDTFDCYQPNFYANSLPAAGSGFSGTWLCGDSPFGTPYSDTFNGYLEGAAGGTLDKGTGLAEGWLWGDSPYGMPLGDTFESYPAGNASGNMNAGTGLIEAWLFTL